MLFPKLDWGKVGGFAQRRVAGGVGKKVLILPQCTNGFAGNVVLLRTPQLSLLLGQEC